MKRKIFTILIGLMMLFSLSSCVVGTYATTQDDIYVEADVDVVKSNVSFDVIIQYGTPYYRDGVLLYYLYRDIYYYPFYYNNYWYVRAYRRPFIHFDHRPYFRPHRYDYKFSPGSYRGFDRPRDSDIHHRNLNPNINQPRRDIQRRPNNSRPDVQPRQPQRQVTPNRIQPQRQVIPNRQQPQRQVIPNRQQPQRQVTPNRQQPQRNGNFGGARNNRR